MDEDIHAPGLLGGDVFGHVEVLHLAGDLGREPGGIEAADAGDTRLARRRLAQAASTVLPTGEIKA
jgi:hypothetical protein